MASDLLRVEGLVKHFDLPSPLFSQQKRHVRAVDGASFSLGTGQTLGIVGESGCGKTTLARAILRLIKPTAGSIVFRGKDLAALSGEALRQERRNLQIVFQDPFGSLNPRMTVRDLVGEPLRVHSSESASCQGEQIAAALDAVGLGQHVLDRHPHEFSGGQRQRIGIARALVLNPALVIADEPVSALDVSVRAQILNLLRRLQQQRDLSYIIVSHDLGAVRFICHYVAVMYLGRIVEYGPVEDVLRNPLHPYTQALVAAVPTPRFRQERLKRAILVGEVPSPINPPGGCHFHPRCPHRVGVCTSSVPVPVTQEREHTVACHLYGHTPYPALSAPDDSPSEPGATDQEQ